MIKIFHNNRCSKSRQTLALLPEENTEVINYLENPPSKAELQSILKMLDMQPSQLIRKGEPIWKENFKGKDLTEEDCLDAMLNYPKLIERPIVINGDKAVIGRPPENALKLLD
jgi:arsenate reductase